MKNTTLSTVPLIIVAMGIAVAASVLAVPLAHADAAPTVTVAILNASNATTTSAQIGSLVYADVSVASSTGSTTPSGTVNVSLYQNTSCSNTATVQSGVPLINGIASSSGAVVPASGLSYLSHYNGDINYPAVDSTCQPLVATASSTALTTTLSTTTSVLAGSSIFDNAMLANETASAGGTVAYTAYTDNACTLGAMSGGIMTVTNGSVPSSNAILFSTPGTYYWQAVYSGDANDMAATSTCGSEVLTVVATTTPPVATTTGVISGEVYNDINRNAALDSGEPGLPGFTIQLSGIHKNYWWSNGTPQVIATAVTDINGNYSFTGLADGTYKVEEIDQAGWTQETSDFNMVVISGGLSQTGLNFANASTTPPKNHGNGGGNGNNGQGNNGGGLFCKGFPFCNGNNGSGYSGNTGGSPHSNNGGRGSGNHGNH